MYLRNVWAFIAKAVKNEFVVLIVFFLMSIIENPILLLLWQMLAKPFFITHSFAFLALVWFVWTNVWEVPLSTKPTLACFRISPDPLYFCQQLRLRCELFNHERVVFEADPKMAFSCQIINCVFWVLLQMSNYPKFLYQHLSQIVNKTQKIRVLNWSFIKVCIFKRAHFWLAIPAYCTSSMDSDYFQLETVTVDAEERWFYSQTCTLYVRCFTELQGLGCLGNIKFTKRSNLLHLNFCVKSHAFNE